MYLKELPLIYLIELPLRYLIELFLRYLIESPLRYLMDQLRKLCEAALVSGVRVTRENLFDLAR